MNCGDSPVLSVYLPEDLSDESVHAILHAGTICVLSNIWNFNASNVLSADLFWV